MSVRVEIVRAASVGLSLAAGMCVTLVLLNRRLIEMPDSPKKTPLMLLMMAAVTGSFVVAGVLLPPLPWAWVPAGVLALALAGELRRLAVRRAHAGSPPIDTVPHQVPYLRPLTTMDIAVHRYGIRLPDWRGAPFRIAHLSDLHVSPSLPVDYYRQAIEMAAEARPDFAFLTGDFVSKLDAVPALDGILRPIGRLGTFAVLGNHDYWSGAEAVRQAIRKAGITLVSDESVRVVHGGAAVEIAGTDYPWSLRDCALPPPEAGVIRLVLSHTPDSIYRLSRQAAHCVFSGHYHAGQVRLPLIGPIVVPSTYGRLFDHGHFVVHGTHLFVASGVGAANPPLRIYCQPDILIVDVTGGEGDAAGEGS